VTGPRRSRDLFALTAPSLFVLLWSTGFIGSKLGLPYTQPLTFLLLRFALVLILLLPAALVLQSRWPASMPQAAHLAVTGMLLHGGYLGGVFSAIYYGAPTGIVSLIVGLQPLLTAAAAGTFLGERVTRRQWLGLAVGVIGVVMTLSDKTAWEAPSPAGVTGAIVGLLSITAGTLYQKRHGAHAGLVAGSVIQFSAAAVLLLPIALLTERMEVRWTGQFIFALGWLVLVLSIGAITLFYVLLLRGEAARVSTLFYATPPTTAVMAWFLFGERLGVMAWAGMGVTAAAIWLAMKR
jgi:drug/metabolite transporter (DMT)-like permease